MSIRKLPTVLFTLLLVSCKHPPPPSEEAPVPEEIPPLDASAGGGQDVEEEAMAPAAEEQAEEEKPAAKFWKHGGHDDAPEWAPIAPPGPDDCWREEDLKRVTWKFGNEINALSHDDDPTCDDALVEAVSEGDAKALKKIIGNVEVNCRSAYDWTPLHEAAMGGYLVVAKLLVNAGADVGACDMNGETPLHLAVKEGYQAIVQLLLARGAYADAADIFTERPLHLVWNGCWDASDNLDPKCSLKTVKALVAKGADVNAATADGETPLHIAADYGDAPSVAFLIEEGANPAAQDANGNTPADVAHGQEVEALFLELLLGNKGGKGLK